MSRWVIRTNHRIPLNLSIIIRNYEKVHTYLSSMQKNTKATLVDLSTDGCALLSRLKVPKNAKINIFIDRNLLVADEETRLSGCTRITAVVMNSCSRGIAQSRLGLKFERIYSKDLELIEKFVQSKKQG